MSGMNRAEIVVFISSSGERPPLRSEFDDARDFSSLAASLARRSRIAIVALPFVTRAC
jgi:hypothetical protein